MFLEVVMPTYNGEKYLAQQVESIYSQTVRPDRLLIRDDGSTDGTICLIKTLQKRYGDWICQLKGREHLGCCASVNVLLEATQARYVALADQDDIWYPDKLEKSLLLLRELEKNHGVDMPLLVHGDLHLVDAGGQPLGHTFFAYQRLDPRRVSPVDLAFTNVVTGCTCLFNKSLTRKALPIPAEAVMHDWWMALVASVYGHIGLLPRPYIDYRQHESNLLGASGVSHLFLLKKAHSLVVSRNLTPGTRAVFRQIEIFSRRYGSEISKVPSLLRISVFARWFAVLRLPSKWRPSRHGPLRSALFYTLLICAPSDIVNLGEQE